MKPKHPNDLPSSISPNVYITVSTMYAFFLMYLFTSSRKCVCHIQLMYNTVQTLNGADKMQHNVIGVLILLSHN